LELPKALVMLSVVAIYFLSVLSH